MVAVNPRMSLGKALFEVGGQLNIGGFGHGGMRGAIAGMGLISSSWWWGL